MDSSPTPGTGLPNPSDATVPHHTPATGSASGGGRRPVRPPAPDEVNRAPPDMRVGKFVRVRKLGSGGMGEVWKAWDQELGRWVALKLLKGGDDDEIARFQREARMAGRLSHPNIAAIYEVGQEAGRHFIAMQFIDGTTLRSCDPRDRKRLALLIRDAARAVAYAHERGVIHRDLKPENLMVGGGREQPQVYVMDFGLARGTEGVSDVSLPGTIIGTPAYMSPEQSRGGKLDERTDVYSLGASLYELLTSRVPFRGASAFAILKRVQEEDPAPPRSLDRTIDRDLETIVLKCMEKEPGRRYRSAAELAADLDRWIDGEPLLARRAGPVYRLRKLLARRKALLITVGASLLVLAAVLAAVAPMLMRSRRDLDEARDRLTRREAELSETQRRLVEQMRLMADACLEVALDFRRNGNLDAMSGYAERLEAACRDVIREMPALAEPHYRLGRLRRAQMREADALAEQERALAKEGDYAPARYERAVMTARLHSRRLAELADVASRTVEPRAARPMWRMLAESDGKARSLVARLESDVLAIEAAAPDAVTSAERACALGLLAWARHDAASAERHLTAAVEVRPPLEEAFEALGTISLSKGDYAAAVSWWSRAAEADRGCIPHHENLGTARFHWALAKAATGEDAEPLYRSAIVDFTRALDLRPDAYEPRVRRAGALANLAGVIAARGGDPSSLERDAFLDLDRAIELDAAPASAWSRRGLTRSNRGMRLETAGADPTREYTLALADLDAALSREPDAWTFSLRASLRSNWGVYLAHHGGDPAPVWTAAIADYEEALGRRPGWGEAASGRGLVEMNWGRFEEDSGRDPIPRYRRAIADFREALEARPDNDETWLNLGTTLSNWGVALARSGRDPVEPFAESVAALSEALSRNPARDETWAKRGAARANWGLWLLQSGGDPEPRWEEAVADYEQALRRRGNASETWLRRANLLLNWGSWLAEQGRDPWERYDEALGDAARAVELNPRDDMARLYLGNVRFNRALARARSGEPSIPEFRAALEAYDEAVALNPRLEETLKAKRSACRRATGEQ